TQATNAYSIQCRPSGRETCRGAGDAPMLQPYRRGFWRAIVPCPAFQYMKPGPRYHCAAGPPFRLISGAATAPAPERTLPAGPRLGDVTVSAILEHQKLGPPPDKLFLGCDIEVARRHYAEMEAFLYDAESLLLGPTNGG